jgi:hypothetical protein
MLKMKMYLIDRSVAAHGDQGFATGPDLAAMIHLLIACGCIDS